jgi:hypothetical protein
MDHYDRPGRRDGMKRTGSRVKYTIRTILVTNIVWKPTRSLS